VTWFCVDCEHRVTDEKVADRHLYELGHTVIGMDLPEPRKGGRKR
jgi:hypothetical protein